VWAGAVLCCGLYHPFTYEEQMAALYHWDLKNYPGHGFVEYALGPGRTYPPHEAEIRSSRGNAHLMPSGVPIVLIHGTRDDNVDIRHATDLYGRLLANG